MEISFYKYQGTGNDFIVIDGRNLNYNFTEKQVESLCQRRFGIGADGFMILLAAHGYDFEMQYFNADGKPGSMCGNGGRCIVQFAIDLGICKDEIRFVAVDGLHLAEKDAKGRIRLKMSDVHDVHNESGDFVLDTGSPHYVKFINDLDVLDVAKEGKHIRNSPKFKDNGINVNFVHILNDHSIYVRTYERGVEDETWSCGTGVTASCLMAAHNESGFNEVDVQTLGGKLTVEFERVNDKTYNNIWLIGPATYVFKGIIDTEKID
jgi:diaminopimelate epimerase